MISPGLVRLCGKPGKSDRMATSGTGWPFSWGIFSGGRRVRHICGFHSLRAFSVILVILSHVGVVEAATNPWLIRFFSVFNASYGVKTFFVLSGFLITTLLLKEFSNFNRVNALHFMARRALRILPLYFLIIFIATILILSGIAEQSWTAMLFGTLYVYNFIPQSENVNYLSHLWSLAVEEQFYLVWPFIFSFWASKRYILISICIAFIATCSLFLFRDLGWLSTVFYTQRWTIPAIYPISIGALLALIANEAVPMLRSYATLAVASLFIILPLVFSGTAAVEILGTLGIAGLVAWIYANQDNRAVQALDWRPIFYIGQISYGLYMWQGLLTGNGPYRPVPGFPPDVIVGALLTFPIAAFSFHVFEKPISDLRRRFPAG